MHPARYGAQLGCRDEGGQEEASVSDTLTEAQKEDERSKVLIRAPCLLAPQGIDPICSSCIFGSTLCMGALIRILESSALCRSYYPDSSEIWLLCSIAEFDV